jgi:hypothetical protein
MVHAYFKSGSEIRKTEYSWGALPLLRLGSTYSNGLSLPNKEQKLCGGFVASDIIGSSIEKAYDVIPKNIYPLSMCNVRAGLEKCQVLHHRDGRKIVIPCLSIIQSFLCPSVFLANRILTSAGLDELSEGEWEDNDKGLYISFTYAYPYLSLNRSHIAYYSWLKSNPLALEAWKRVFVSLTNHFVETLFPFNRHEYISCYGLSTGKTILALHVEANNSYFPYEKIYVYHPLLYNRKKDFGDKERTIPDNPDDENAIILNSSDCAASGKAQQIESSFQPSVSFSRRPQIKRISENDKHIIKSKLVRDSNLPLPQYTTQDSGTGPQARPVEVEPITETESTATPAPEGLELFYEALDVLRTSSSLTAVTVNNYPIPSSKIFASASGTQKRSYSMAKIDLTPTKQLFVLEASHAQSWSLSTLVVTGTGDLEEIREKVFTCLLRNSGHWNMKQLHDIGNWRFRTIKHFENRSAFHFAELIITASY